MLGRLIRRSTPSSPELDSLRNAAFNAWVSTWPEDKRLDAFLAGIDPKLRREVGRSARDFFKTGKRLYYGGRFAPGDWEQAFKRDLLARFSWMSDESFATLLDHSYWESK